MVQKSVVFKDRFAKIQARKIPEFPQNVALSEDKKCPNCGSDYCDKYEYRVLKVKYPQYFIGKILHACLNCKTPYYFNNPSQ